MNQETNVLNVVKVSLLDSQLNQMKLKFFKTSEPQAALSCLSLFENESCGSPDVIILDNIRDISCLVLLKNKIEHFYLGFDSDFQLTSKGYIYVNKAKGENYSMFSERSTVIFKDHLIGNQFANEWLDS